MIIYTSGTTSRPKGAMHCHLAVVMAVMSNVVEMNLDRDDRRYRPVSAVPLRRPCAAAELSVGRRPDGADARLRSGRLHGSDRARQAHRLRRPSLMYQPILDHPRRRDFDLSGLKTCIYTMAPMGRPLMERAIADMCPNFVLASGQTEMYPATTMSKPDRQLKRFGNYWGKSLIVNETAIMDDDGNLLPRGQAGELVHRGPNVMMGYYKDPKATEEARKFGWHHTGDLALIDEHGEVLFVDRKKDMIKSGGENVASVKIEETLLAHPAVRTPPSSACRIRNGARRSRLSSSSSRARKPTEAGHQHCRKRLSGFQVPKLVEDRADDPDDRDGQAPQGRTAPGF